jgi:hypothetical protein
MKILRAIIPCVAITICSYAIHAQSAKDELNTVTKLDSAFWQHYNACNVEAMRNFFTGDLEFYHDKGGPTNGLENFLTAAKRNLCSNDNFRLKREAVTGTIRLFPMYNGATLYGAILTGQHVFYVIENGSDPRLDGLARFNHLWIKTESGWKMSRVLSYDHGPAPYVNKRKQTVLDEKTLRHFAGEYQSKSSGLLKVAPSSGTLQLFTGDKVFELFPESKNLFFINDRDVTFEFLIDKIVIREHGKIVDEPTVISKK